jgi:hypothetical protein
MACSWLGVHNCVVKAALTLDAAQSRVVAPASCAVLAFCPAVPVAHVQHDASGVLAVLHAVRESSQRHSNCDSSGLEHSMHNDAGSNNCLLWTCMCVRDACLNVSCAARLCSAS